MISYTVKPVTSSYYIDALNIFEFTAKIIFIMNILLRQVASCRNILRPNNYGPPCVIDINTAMLRVYGGAVRNSIKMAVSNFFISFLNLFLLILVET